MMARAKKRFDVGGSGLTEDNERELDTLAAAIKEHDQNSDLAWYRIGKCMLDAERIIGNALPGWVRSKTSVSKSCAYNYMNAARILQGRVFHEADLHNKKTLIYRLAEEGTPQCVRDEWIPRILRGIPVKKAEIEHDRREARAAEGFADEPATVRARRPSKAEADLQSRADELEKENTGLKRQLDEARDREWRTDAGPAPTPDFATLIDELRAEIADLKNKLTARDTILGQTTSAERQTVNDEGTVVPEPQEASDPTEQAHEHDDAAGPEDITAAATPDPAEAELARIEDAKDKNWKDVLGFGFGRIQILDPIARQPQIREEYHRLVKICHPAGALTAEHQPRREDALKALNCARDTGLAEAREMAGGRRAA
ncbi:hypothetical protein [Methylobacterium sp. 1030]|uniref:hypothetical protein n=1 Tax=Methylobacterium sp. 1030 TaxID=3156404 RepID=UPI0033941BF3